MNTRNAKSEELTAPLTGFAISDIVKLQLVRKFQRLEGRLDCYASVCGRVCNQFECLWRDDCLAMMYNGDSHEWSTYHGSITAH
jgi:hypothetical protein